MVLPDDVVTGIKRVLRGADVLCRYSDTEFVVVLTQTDSIAAAAVASRIAEIIVEARPSLMETARLTLGVASAPNDGRTLPELVATAQQHRWIPPTGTPESTWRRALAPPCLQIWQSLRHFEPDGFQKQRCSSIADPSLNLRR